MAVFRVVATLNLWEEKWALAEGSSVQEGILAIAFESLLKSKCLQRRERSKFAKDTFGVHSQLEKK